MPEPAGRAFGRVHLDFPSHQIPDSRADLDSRPALHSEYCRQQVFEAVELSARAHNRTDPVETE